jgi:hypothetical protein
MNGGTISTPPSSLRGAAAAAADAACPAGIHYLINCN